MKKLATLFLAGALLFGTAGCGMGASEKAQSSDGYGTSVRESAETGKQIEELVESYCYVVCVKRNGFIVSINDVGYVYIRYAHAKDEIEIYNTVIVEYDPADLMEQSGIYIGSAGEIEEYSFKLQNPRSVRIADPSKGEPVFG